MNIELRNSEEQKSLGADPSEILDESEPQSLSHDSSPVLSQTAQLSSSAQNAASEIQNSLEKNTPDMPALSCFSIEPIAVAKAKISGFIDKNKSRLFACLSLVLLAFGAVFGKLAILAFLLWAAIFCVLSVPRFSSKFTIGCDENGIAIKKNDSLGAHQIKVPWSKINSVSDEDSEDNSSSRRLVIAFVDRALSLPNRLIFEDLLLDRKNIAIDSRICGESFSSLREMLLTNCPAAFLISVSPQISKAEPGTSVQYLPFHKERRFVSNFLSKYESPLIKLFSILLVCSFFAFGGRFSFLILLGSALPLILLSEFLRQTPVRLLLDDRGLTVKFSALGNGEMSQTYTWDTLKSVYRLDKMSRKGFKSELAISLLPSGSQRKQLAFLPIASMGLFKKIGDSLLIKIDIDDFSAAADRVQLLSALKKYCDPELVEKSVAEMLHPTDSASYTKLWMDSFSRETGSRRLEGKLSEGHFLRNGQLAILKLIGSGGQANAYLAANMNAENSEKEVVLKEFILPSHAGAEISLRSLEHIENELSLMKKIEHPNIVRYYELFVEDHRCYLVLEHINGKSLRDLVESEGPLEQRLVIDLSRQMASILAHLHSQNPPIVHRDFTPENLILDENGILKLIDFNVAQELEEGATRTIVGKHSYLPPEQFRGKACAQSDIYAFGASLYYLLTAEEPEPISCSHPILKNESILPAFESIVSRATELELAHRIKNTAELIELIEAMEEQPET